MAREDRTPAEQAAADAVDGDDDEVVCVVAAGNGRSRYMVTGIVSARIVARSGDRRSRPGRPARRRRPGVAR